MEIAKIVESRYNDSVFRPSLVSLLGSLMEIVPHIIETKISGKTIIFNNVRNINPIVSNTPKMMIFLRGLSSLNNRLKNIPTNTPNNIAKMIFFVKLIDNNHSNPVFHIQCYNIRMSGKKRSNWFKSHTDDFFVRLSKQDNFRSRAAYKLIEIEEKYQIISQSKNIIDLGCAPGSWLQVLINFKNLKSITGIDRNEVEPIQGVNFIKCDIQNKKQVANALKQINQKTDLVLSDIAPNITGIGDVDQANFVDITSNVLSICEQISLINGNLVMKIFNGERLSDIKGLLLSKYRDIVVFKPKSSKKNSSEIYIVCNGYKD